MQAKLEMQAVTEAEFGHYEYLLFFMFQSFFESRLVSDKMS